MISDPDKTDFVCKICGGELEEFCGQYMIPGAVGPDEYYWYVCSRCGKEYSERCPSCNGKGFFMESFQYLGDCKDCSGTGIAGIRR